MYPFDVVSICTNPIWLIRTRLELQSPLHQSQPYSGVYVTHGAIQFTAYEELRRIMVDYEERKKKPKGASNLLQQPSNEGIPRYTNSWHVVKETAWFEGFHRFYKGINPNLLRHVPASSITFIVCENIEISELLLCNIRKVFGQPNCVSGQPTFW
ncbi:Mitochondrial folate transporter/carrier [Gossypium arboreum]|uniref:Mitochondrial folate transporter/carrier n=1 Tax=Gossypium arboreum TaxID=29729 RepID=A0A0B0P8U5_GOSAR|nr:Mitochondrial folate transporter/carrier [Gossypium arboreum]